MYVDFETTIDREAREILELLERAKFKDFCSMKSTEGRTLDLLGVKFLVKGEFEANSISSIVNGDTVEMSKATIGKTFNSNSDGVDPFVYKESDYLESFELMARLSQKHIRRD